MSAAKKRPPPKRNTEPLKIDLPFEDAVKAALETRPPPKAEVKTTRKKRPS